MLRFRYRAALVAAAVLAVAGPAGGIAQPSVPAAAEAPPANALLPDLGALPPRNISIEQVRVKKTIEKRLRFDTLMANSGAGPLELFPGAPGCDQHVSTATREAWQRVFVDDNRIAGFQRTATGPTPADSAITQLVGCMVYHPKHHHWHVEGFAAYRLYHYTSDTAIDPSPVATSNKVSFCMLDMEWEGGGTAPAPYYSACGENATMGISVNWADNYYSGLADQWIVFPNNQPDGNYCLVNIGNIAAIEPTTSQSGQPLPGLIESNHTHPSNANGVKIQISNSGTAVTPSTTPCLPT